MNPPLASVVVANEGYLPTNITQRAVDAEIAVPVRAEVQLADAELVTGSWRAELGHIEGSRDTRGPAGTAQARRTLEWVVRITGNRPVLSVTVRSEKGGTVRRVISLER